MSNLYVPTKDELKTVVSEAVQDAIKVKLPETIRRATQKKWLSTEEVCEILNVSRRHLQHLRDTGQIPYSQHGRKIYFKSEDLEEFFEEHYIEAQRT